MVHFFFFSLRFASSGFFIFCKICHSLPFCSYIICLKFDQLSMRFFFSLVPLFLGRFSFVMADALLKAKDEVIISRYLKPMIVNRV